MSFERFTNGDRPETAVSTDPPLLLQEWLDDLMHERETVIMRLRQLDDVLVRHGRLRVETLPRRVR